MRTTQCTGVPPLVDSALGIWFDGRAYHYQQYRYDRLSDAVAYAAIDGRRASRPPHPLPDSWTEWHAPDAADRARMAAYGIGYEQGMFQYRGYRYDYLDQALAYAAQAEATGAAASAPHERPSQ